MIQSPTLHKSVVFALIPVHNLRCCIRPSYTAPYAASRPEWKMTGSMTSRQCRSRFEPGR